MATIATQSKNTSSRGQAISFGNSAAGDEFEVGNDKVMLLWNTSGSAATATFAVPGTNDLTGAANPDNVETVANNEIRMVPLDGRYADAAIGGRGAVSYSVTGATFRRAVISVV